MRPRISVPCVLSCVLLTIGFAANFWDTKPYTSWGKKQCERLITQSPWAHPYAITWLNMDLRRGSNRRYGDEYLDPLAGDREVRCFFQIRLLTAKPIKAALGRLKILASPQDRGLSELVERYVNQRDSTEIVIELTYFSDPPGDRALRAIGNSLRSITFPELLERVWLSDLTKENRAPLKAYEPLEGYRGARLSFPRFNENGAPHFDGSEREILFHMEIDLATVDLHLKPANMRFQGEFAF